MKYYFQPSIIPPSEEAMEEICSLLQKLQEVDSPLEKLEHLLTSIASIFNHVSFFWKSIVWIQLIKRNYCVYVKCYKLVANNNNTVNLKRTFLVEQQIIDESKFNNNLFVPYVRGVHIILYVLENCCFQQLQIWLLK